MDKFAILERLAATKVADLPGTECHELAAAIAKLTDGKAPGTMAQKRMFLDNWFSDNKHELQQQPASTAVPRARTPIAAPRESRHEPQHSSPPVGKGSVLAHTPPRSPPRAMPFVQNTPQPQAPQPVAPPPPTGLHRTGELDSVDAIVGAVAQFRGGEMPVSDVHEIASAIQRIDSTRQPAALEQKRIYIDDFFRAKTGAPMRGEEAYGLHAAPSEPCAPFELGPIESGEELLDAIHGRILHGGGWLSSMDEALPLARAVHGFTHMPTDGSDPQTYVADWYNWVRHTSHPLPQPASNPLDSGALSAFAPQLGGAHPEGAGADELRREIAELNYQVRSLKQLPSSAQQQPPGGDAAGKENALWALVSSLTQQVQTLTSQVASTSEKSAMHSQQMLQAQMQAQQQLAQQQLAAMQMAFQRGGARHADSPLPALSLAPAGGAAEAEATGADTDAGAAAAAEGARAAAAGLSPLEVERQLLEYLSRFFDHGKDVPLENLSKARAPFCARAARPSASRARQRRQLPSWRARALTRAGTLARSLPFFPPPPPGLLSGVRAHLQPVWQGGAQAARAQARARAGVVRRAQEGGARAAAPGRERGRDERTPRRLARAAADCAGARRRRGRRARYQRDEHAAQREPAARAPRSGHAGQPGARAPPRHGAPRARRRARLERACLTCLPACARARVRALGVQVPKLSSSISEMSSKNAPKLIKDKRDFIKEYYRKQLTLRGLGAAGGMGMR